MTAEHPIIEAMARAMHDDMARRDGYNPQPDWYDSGASAPLSGEGFVALWEGHARAALRALYDHGPTADMVDAGWKESWKRDDSDVSCTPSDLFRAMLAAVLTTIPAKE